jgi:hypothetical protein
MSEIENARLAKRVVRIVCIGIIGLASGQIWGTAETWLALSIATLFTVGLTGIEQEVRRFSDALMRAEQRATGEPP